MMNAAFDRSSLDTERVLRTIARMLRGLEFSDPQIEIEIQNIARRLDVLSGEPDEIIETL